MTQRKSSPGQLVGVMIISVLILALTGLFGIWYSHQQAMEGLKQVTRLTRLIDSARQTQVEFKTQVQLWKNLLLRGQNPEDLAQYTSRFKDQNDLVHKSLREVLGSEELPPELKPEVEAILNEHAQLWEKYQNAMASYSSTDPASIFLVDHAVRGIDQALNTRIDKLAVALVGWEANRIGELSAQNEKLYRTLRLVDLLASALAVLCAGLLAWKSLRRSAEKSA